MDRLIRTRSIVLTCHVIVKALNMTIEHIKGPEFRLFLISSAQSEDFAKSLRLLMPMKFVPKVRLKSTKQSGCFGEFKSLDAESVRDRVSRWVTSIMQVDVSLSYAVTNLDKVLWINRFRLTQSSNASTINTVRSAVSFMDESSLSCRVSRFRVVSLARVPKRDSRFFEPVPEVLP